MANNLDQQKQMNELLERQNQLWEAQSKNLKVQSALMAQLVSSMQNLNPKDQIEGMTQLNDLIKQMRDNGEDLGDGMSDAFGRASRGGEEAYTRVNKLKNALSEMKNKVISTIEGWKKLSVGLSAAEGALRGFAFSFNLIKNAGSLITSLAGTIFQVGAAILSLPFRIWDAFLGMQVSGSSEWRQALEEVRKAFGDLTKNSAADLLKMEKNLNGVIAETGLSTYRIFGNRAEQLNALREYATKLGAAFNVLSSSIASSADETERFAAYMKGLGMSDAGIKGVGERAVALGTTVNEIGRQITTFAFQVGEAFGINGRQISADVGEMIGDISHFGNLTVKEMTQAAVFTRKLGLEFKAILGTVEAFDNFDKAAEGAAQLSQAFGMNIDAMQMVREQDPAARFEALRRSFFATGKAAESMTRQELNLLAAQTGLSAEAVKLGFASKNQAMSYDQVQKSADGAAKKQLTQEEAMQKLANSIDRMVKSGSQLQGGFIQHFISGFERGIMRSREFREMFWAIRRALRDTYWAGVQVGRMFVQMFPGVKQIFSGIAGIFDRGRFQKFLGDIKATFFNFFRDIADNPQQGVQRFLNSLKENFLNWFNGGSAEGSQVLEGLKTFFKAIIGIITQLGRIAIQGLIDGARGLIDFIRNPRDLGVADAANDFVEGTVSIFAPLWDMLSEMVPQLGEALWDLITAAWDWAWPQIKAFLYEYRWELGAILFGPSLVGSIGGAVSSLILSGLASGIGLATRAAGAMAVGGRAGLTKLVENMAGIGAAAPRTPPATPPVAPGFFVTLKGTITELNAITPQEITAAAGRIALVVFFMTVGMLAFITAIVILAGEIKKQQLDTTSILLASTIMVAAAAITVALALTAKAIGAGTSAYAEGLKGMGPLFLFVTAFAGICIVLGILIAAMSKLGVQEMLAGAAVIGVLTLIMLAMIPLAIGSAALAAGIASTGGLGLAAAMAGLAALAAFALEAVAFGKEIIDAANEITIQSGLETKVQLLVSILTALGTLSSSLAGMSSSAASVSDGDSQKFQENLTKVNDLMTNIKDTARSFINSSLEIAGGITQAQLEKLPSVISILTAIGEFTKSMSDVIAAGRAGGALISDAGALTNFENTLINLLGLISGNYVLEGGATFPSLGALLKGIIDDLLPAVSGISPEQFTVLGKAFTEILGSMGNFIKNIGEIARSVGTDSGVLTAVRTFIVNIMNGLLGGTGGTGTPTGGSLGQLFRSVLDSLTSFAHAITAEDVKKIEPLAGLIGPLLSAISEVTKAVSTIGRTAVTPSEGDTPIDPAVFTNMGTMITTIFTALREFLPNLITNLNTTLSGVDARSLGAKAKALAPVFTLLLTVQELIGKFYWGVRNAGGGGADAATLTTGLERIGSIFTSSTPGSANFFTILTSIINGVRDNLTTTLLNSINSIDTRKLNKLKTVMETLKTVAETFTAIKTAFTRVDSAGATRILSVATIDRIFLSLVGIMHAVSEKLYQPAGTTGENLKFNQWLNKFRSANIDTTVLSKLNTTLGTLASIATNIVSIKTTAAGLTGENATNIHEIISPVVTAILALTEEEYNGRTLPTILSEYSGRRFNPRIMTAAAQSITALNPVITAFGQMKQQIETQNISSTEWINPYFDSIALVASEAARVNEELAQLAVNPIPIVANLERIMNSFGREIVYSVDTGRIQFSINLQVNVDAKEFATKLIDADARIASTE